VKCLTLLMDLSELLACMFIVTADELCRRSVNKPLTGVEMEQQLLKQLQQECNASRHPMSSRERACSESSESMSNQPLGEFACIYMHNVIVETTVDSLQK